MTFRRGFQIALLLAAVLGAAGYWRFSSLPEVEAVAIRRGTAAEIVYATGVVEPRYWSKVSTLQRERIVEICDCEGKRVKRGDVLARLDPTKEKAQLDEMEARRERLVGDVARAKLLLERKVGTQTAYEQVLTQMQEYDARIAAQKRRIEDLILRAPMDGVVLRKDGEVGEIAATTENAVLFWVGEPKPLRIVADVNEEDIPRVKVGQKVLLRSEAFKEKILPATVADITPKGDPVNKTFRVYLALPEGTPLVIGMSVEANIVVEEKAGVLLIPAEALVDGAAFRIVGRRLAKVQVETGIRGTRMVEVVTGLDEGAVVASPAALDFYDGERVRVMRPKAEAPGGDAAAPGAGTGGAAADAPKEGASREGKP